MYCINIKFFYYDHHIVVMREYRVKYNSYNLVLYIQEEKIYIYEKLKQM